MTVHVLSRTSAASTPGAARAVPLVGLGARTMQIAVYDYDCGTDNYSVNGNDISDIWDDFTDVLYVGIEQKDTSTEADRRDLTVDYTAKTLLIYDAFNTEETASNQTVVACRLLVVGYK